MVDNDPIVRSFVIIAWTVTDGRPEDGVALSSRPDALQRLVGDVCILRQPVHHLTRLQRVLPLHANGRIPEVVTQLMSRYSLQPKTTHMQCHTHTQTHHSQLLQYSCISLSEDLTKTKKQIKRRCHKNEDENSMKMPLNEEANKTKMPQKRR